MNSQIQRICRQNRHVPTLVIPIAMQKVEGSSPFSRSSENPRSSGVFCVSGRRCHRHPLGNNVGPVQCGFRIIGGAR